MFCIFNSWFRFDQVLSMVINSNQKGYYKKIALVISFKQFKAIDSYK